LRRSHGDQGFTLYELLIVLAILPIVIGGLAVVLISNFTTSGSVVTRLTDSHDTQIASAYFVRDVQTAQSVSAATSPLCASAKLSGQLLGLSWSSNGHAYAVTYGLSTTPPASWLIRTFCVDGSVSTTSTVAANVFSTPPPSPAITNDCGGTSSCARSGAHVGVEFIVHCQNGSISCANGGSTTVIPGGGSVGVKGVTLTLNTADGKYSSTVSAAPRVQQQGPTNAPGSAAPPLILLGAQGLNGPLLSCSGSGGTWPITVNGAVEVNSSASPSINLGGNYSLDASNVISENQNPSAAVSGNYTGPTSYTPTITDPYLSLPDPTSNHVDSTSTTLSSNSVPGVFTKTITGASGTIPAGTYILEGGVSLSGNNALKGNNVLLFIGTPNDPNPQSAGFSISGNATVSLTPEASGTWQGITIFQARSDSTTVNISGNGASQAYGGVIYAPAAQVNPGGNGAISAAGIVAKQVTCAGGGSSGALLIGDGPFVLLSFPAYSTTPIKLANWATLSSAGGCTNSAICGTATDISAALTNPNLQVSVENNATGQCWDGTKFQVSCDKWLAGTLTASGSSGETWTWKYAWKKTNFPGTGTYTVKVQVTDAANQSATTIAVFTLS
jgi:prepilin-type N-terminal cleavage/methylation domain-containing protein